MDRGTGRYATLDGIRGVAAITVVVYHLGAWSTQYVPLGYLAVDFFFALSGFVLAGAYADRLRAGLTLGRFAAERLVRLYPMYLTGFVVGTTTAIVPHLVDGSRGDAVALVAPALFNAVGLPNLAGALLYPFNGPSWSLLLEVAVNLLFAAGLFTARRGVLVALCLFSGLVLAFTLNPPLYANTGWRWDNVAVGCIRTLFSFTLGVLLSQRFAAARPGPASPWALLPPVLLGLALLIPHLHGHEAAWEFTVIALLSPALVVLGARREPPERWRSVFTILGDVSFPLYAVHWPLIALFVAARDRLRLPDPALILGFCAVSLGIAALLSYTVDTPLRRSLSARLRRRSVEPTRAA